MKRRIQFDQGERQHHTCRLATLNVDGRMRLEGRVTVGNWESGAEVDAAANKEWTSVESYMEGKALVVLTDVCMNGPQLKAAMARLEASASGAWRCHGTQGRFCPADKRGRGGLMMVWDETYFTAVDTQVISPGRLAEVTLQDKAGEMVTILGAYMPTRGKAEHVVTEEWEVVREVVADRPGYMIIGDLNAELPDALERAGRLQAPYPTMADRWMQQIVDENAMVSTGPGQATYEKGGHESQLDWILADPEIAPRMGAGVVEPGISAHDHRALSVEYTPEGVTAEGQRRPMKPRLGKIDEEGWKEIGTAAGEAVDRAIRGLQQGEAEGREGPIARHNARQAALLRLVQDKLEAAQKKSEDGRAGAGGKSKYERLRAQTGKWEGLRVSIAAAPPGHEWFTGAQRKIGRRIWKVRELKLEALAQGRTPRERRARMLKIATYEAAKAREAFFGAKAEGGEKMLEELRDAVREGGEGGVTAALFTIINKALRRESKAKGAKKQAKRVRPQVLLSALFEDDDKERGVVLTSAKRVMEEVRRISTRTNKAGRSFPDIARGMMARLSPFPAAPPRDEQWIHTHMSFDMFEVALGKTNAGVGVGGDGFPAYILRYMPEQVRRDYHADLCEILRGGEYPEEWKEWIALLAMKPGEDARELGRRRDLWLAPHALKLVTRCMTAEFDRAVHESAPASNAGFTQGASGPAQTLTLKLHRARCRREGQDYAVGFCDMGCYFMSICRDVQKCAQEWAGVTPEVTDVMAAMQRGIKGRSETAYGLTEPYEIGRGIMQGCIGSPARSLLQLRFMQAIVHDACRGYKFRTRDGKGGVPMVYYCDDGAFMSESIAGVQMALDACWVAARVAGLDLRTKAKDAITRRGTKTAWMGCYFDSAGREREVTGWDMWTPTGERIPQVSQYTHLGVSIQAKWEGRHDEARRNVTRKCMQMLGLIAKVEALGPAQVTQAMNMAIGGIIGYTGRSTPIGWAACTKIEAARAAALKQAGLAGGRRRAPLYLPEEAGGLGHIHSYQVAAAALADEFERAFNAGPGEPAKEAVEGAVAEAGERLGVGADLYEWLPDEEAMKALDEDDEVEAWLLCKARARVTKRAGAGRCDRVQGSRGGGGVQNGDGSRLLRRPVARAGDKEEAEGDTWEVGGARRTATCMGGWEYEIVRGGEARGCWVNHRDVPKQVTTAQLAEARSTKQVPESLRARLEKGAGPGGSSSVGRWQVALTGDPAKAETVRAVERLVKEWKVHVEEAGSGEGWNVEDKPRSERPGAKGGWEEHSSKVARSYYRGGKETITVINKKGDGEKKERSRMGLDADKPWERELPQEVTVSIDQVQRAIEAGEEGRGTFPEHEPHTHVQHDIVLHYNKSGQGKVWAGDRRQRDEEARAAAERDVWALPDEADETEVGEAMQAAWRGAVEAYVIGQAEGWTATEKETAVRMAIRESLGEMPGGGGLGAEKGRRPGPFVSGGMKGYAMIREEALRRDPLTRTMLRWDEWEGGVSAIAGGKEGGRQVECGEKTQRLMRSDGSGYQTWWALAGTLLPLHYYHHFTRCGFTDGSLEDPRREGGSGRRRVAYGVWEGIQWEADLERPPGGWDSYTPTERLQRCVGAGMWGGACPPDWEIGDAEAYAIYRYLESVESTSGDPASERVLVCSDSQTTLDKLEEAWRATDTRKMRAQGGAGITEAVCRVRARLGRVIMVYCPAHRGIAGNEYADAIAQAHLGAEVEDTATVIAPHIETRQGVTIAQSEYGEDLVHTERKYYRQMKRSMGWWVRRKLMETVHNVIIDGAHAHDNTTAYGKGKYCTEVVIGTGRGRKVEQKDGEGDASQAVKDMEMDRRRVGLGHRIRGKDVGLPHDGVNEIDIQEGVGAQGVVGSQPGDGWAASGRMYKGEERCRALGCVACRKVGDIAACRACGGWIGRQQGAPPACDAKECPGATCTRREGGWIREEGAKGRGRTATRTDAPRRGEGGRTRQVLQPPRDYPKEGDKETWEYMGEGEKGMKMQYDARGRQARDEGPRVAHTTTERLRRAAGIRNPDTRLYKTGAPLATLQHILTGCAGLPEKSRTKAALVEALCKMEKAVPMKGKEGVQCNREFRKVIHEAKMRLQAGDEAALSEQRWRRLEEVLAGCVPDFGRQGGRKERKAMVAIVIEAVQQAQGAALGAIERWQGAQRGALERRREGGRLREVLRTVLLAWREEADSRQARSTAPAGGRGEARGCTWLPGRGKPRKERHPRTLGSQATTHMSQVSGALERGRDPLKEKGAYATGPEVKKLKEMRERPRSAIPPGSQARVLMTWARLTGGPERARRWRDRVAWEGRRPGAERVQSMEEAREAHTEGGPTSREDGRLWSRAHTAEWQGSVAMQRLFAQANASGHSRGDRVAGLAVAARREEVGKEERAYKYRRTWMEERRELREEEGEPGVADTGEEEANPNPNLSRGSGQGEEAIGGDQEEWEEAMGGLEGGEDYEMEMEREMHGGAEAEWGAQEGYCSMAPGAEAATAATKPAAAQAPPLAAALAPAPAPAATAAPAADTAAQAPAAPAPAATAAPAAAPVAAAPTAQLPAPAATAAAAATVTPAAQFLEVTVFDEVTDTGENGATEAKQQRRSGRKHARSDALRSEKVEAQGRLGAGKRRRRACRTEEGWDGARGGRAGARERVAGRIEELARREGRGLERDMRGTGGVDRMREKWRWSLLPAGAREQLVIFDHGERGGAPDQEVRAAVLESEYGRGLFYASSAAKGKEVGYYAGEEVTLQQYMELDEDTGLRHTLEIGGKLVNGIHGVTGMQYANTSRGGVEANNASFAGTSVIRVSAAGGVVRGQPVLLPYKWSAAAWAEIESRVVGVCAYEERGGEQGMGKEGGTYIVEWVSTLRRGGLATQMLREARKGWAPGKGRVELQVHRGNVRARGYYGRLGMRRCKWWEDTKEGEGSRVREAWGGSLYEPRPEFQMMQVEAKELEAELALRADRRVPTTGVEYICVQGVEGLRDAGVLSGVRAMVARVYGGEEWYVNDDGCGRAECLYERAGTRVHATRFIVARRVGDDRWERHGDERGVDDEYDGGQEDDYMYENQREGSGEARETARGGADDAMEGRRAVEGGGPGDATEGGEGGQRRRGKRKILFHTLFNCWRTQLELFLNFPANFRIEYLP